MIKAFLLSAILFAGVAHGQGAPIRMEVTVGASTLHYNENPARLNAPELTGNSVSVPIHIEAQYSAATDLRLPVWLLVAADLPTIASAGEEIGKITRDAIEFTVQKENVVYRPTTLSASLGFEVLPFLQPYLMFEYSHLASRRTDQQNGQQDGTFLPEPNQDYTETVGATLLGVGCLSVIPLEENAASRLRLNVAYVNAQSVSVANDYYGEGLWGQHTSGYELKGRIAFETSMRSLALGQDPYLTLGIDATTQRWDGNGRTGAEVFQHPVWPANTITGLGAFAGLGLFF